MATFATIKDRIATKRAYPGIMGTAKQPSAVAGPHGVQQQFIDRRLQKELTLSRRALWQGPDKRWRHEWVLSFYIHPGLRREVPVQQEVLPDLVDRLHALAIGVGPTGDPDRRLDDWVVFHTFGAMGRFETGKDALRYLQAAGFPFEAVEKYITEYGIKTFDSSKGGT